MSATEPAHAAWSHTTPMVDAVMSLTSAHIHRLGTAALAASPSPNPTGSIATDAILGFLASKIAPILLAILGVIFISRASKGEVSKVVTSSAIAIIGLAFILGAGALLLLGDNLVSLVFE